MDKKTFTFKLALSPSPNISPNGYRTEIIEYLPNNMRISSKDKSIVVTQLLDHKTNLREHYFEEILPHPRDLLQCQTLSLA